MQNAKIELETYNKKETLSWMLQIEWPCVESSLLQGARFDTISQTIN